jgi:gliding motility-associated lipoprotein GldH
MRIYISITIFLLVLISCREPAAFREYKKMDNISWNRFDILNFEVPVKNGEQLDFDLAIRHHTDFPFETIWVNITFYSPDETMRSRDYELEFKNEDGKWKADGLGDLWDIEFPIIHGMSFYKDGICKVRVENKMSKFETPGIIEVGLIARKSEE